MINNVQPDAPHSGDDEQSLTLIELVDFVPIVANSIGKRIGTALPLPGSERAFRLDLSVFGSVVNGQSGAKPSVDPHPKWRFEGIDRLANRARCNEVAICKSNKEKQLFDPVGFLQGRHRA